MKYLSTAQISVSSLVLDSGRLDFKRAGGVTWGGMKGGKMSLYFQPLLKTAHSALTQVRPKTLKHLCQT